ncbi:MAG: AmmeMemoRadiSam system protein A [Desulfotomaculaceae bacterium]|nr:AmmeMemoRadiSam system protein A [Desulfotomaculaceae bacterium]MDD4766834.1 AmmeMemoRadiSam system protein A [Desulfotomaculaceae bacterium]
MSVVFCGICPHPPIAVPEVGGEEASKVSATQEALLELGRRVVKSAADTVVIISPHAPIFRDVVGINLSPQLKGDLGNFRAGNVRYLLDNDLALAREIKRQSADMGMPAVELTEEEERQYGISLRLDHGVVVPVYFLRRAKLKTPLVHVSMGLGPPQKLYLFGVAVRKAAETLGRRVALLASGDLSHGLTDDAPGGYLPGGKEFDSELARLLAVPDAEGIVKMDPKLVASAGECGYHSIVMMLGALDGYDVKAEVLSYEGPFGVGYLVASLEPEGKNPEKSFLQRMRSERQAEREKKQAGESYLVKLARNTLESYVSGSPPPAPAEIPEEFKKKAGVFVSIKKHGQLRGCIGTIEPVRSGIVEEVTANAISAGAHDPRFQPVRKDELDDLDYSVDVLQPPEPISYLHQLDPVKYGVIVRSGRRSGLLLPNLEGIDTAEEQVRIARQKAGIRPDEPVELERFEVVRYK